jgi:hypothetical protein
MVLALRIVSLLTLVALGAAIAGQALVVALGVYYTPDGQPVDPTPLAVTVSILAGFGGLLAMPLALATFILGLVATAVHQRYGWLVAAIVAGALSLVGLVSMAWVLLSVRSPIAFQAPLIVIPLVTLAYSLWPQRGRRTTAITQ